MTGIDVSTPRLAPIPTDQLAEDARAMLRGHVQVADRYLAGGPDAPRMPNVLGLLAHHPELTGPWLAYNGVLLQQPTVDPTLRELIVLRVAARTGCEYEWSQHARMAADLGLEPARIEAIRAGEDAALSPVQRLVRAATDELLDHHRVLDPTWTELTRHFDSRQLLELLFVAGSYLCLALVFNSVALQPDPEEQP